MAESRVFKNPMELGHSCIKSALIVIFLYLDVLRYANQLSSKAHMHVMRTMKPGMFEI